MSSEHGKTKVLFICVHNSARSQIAEEYLRRLGSDLFEVESAGLEPGTMTCRERRADDPEWTPFTEAADLTGAVDVLA